MTTAAAPSIEIVGLGKRYDISTGPIVDYMGLHAVLERAIRAPARALMRRRRLQPEQHDDRKIWALRDVSFQVDRGEIVALLGQNGAGKSVLLKILSRITRPNEGHAVIRGRVGSLLEAGAGFHPELTGRENIVLNGTILGMSRFEVARHFDRIVDFSGIAKFLDTPVKRYSTGMNLRLAFAVLAHLRSEIMLIDEILAVGDEAFREQCLAEVRELARSGRAVIIVSHSVETVRSVCSRAIYLRQGRLIDDGPVERVIAHYRAEG